MMAGARRALEEHLPPAAEGASIDEDGLRVPTAWQEVFDVLLEDRRIWSVAPSRHAVESDGLRLVPWPEALLPYLNGLARVTLREHGSGCVLVNREHSFGRGSGRVRVTDDEGRSLAIGKAGFLEPPFEAGGVDMARSLLAEVVQVLGVLRDECDLPAFISYGMLLGAAREGKLIGHDSDADVAYLSAYSHPADVIRESFRIERTFRRNGFSHERFAAGDFKVKVADADGAVRGIDVFVGFLLEGYLHLMPYVRARLQRSAILPLGEVKLEGQWLPAPADPPALLEATYGPGWRVPDPSFTFRPLPPATRRRLTGWMRGLHTHRGYWDNFYRARSSVAVPQEPSTFARWVEERIPPHGPVVDIGCGTGRDALWLARGGHRVLGLDYAPSTIEQTRNAADEESLPGTFEVFDLYELRAVLTMGARLAGTEGGTEGMTWTLYGRFLLHAIEDDGRHHLWRLAEMVLRRGGRLFLEFRTGKDAGALHEFGEHFRRFLNPDTVVDEIESRAGYVEYREEGHGLAPFGREDPHVCRLVVGWQR